MTAFDSDANAGLLSQRKQAPDSNTRSRCESQRVCDNGVNRRNNSLVRFVADL